MSNFSRINPGFIYQETDDEVSFFDPDTSTLYSLNSTASFLVKELKKGTDNEQIIKKFVTLFNIAEDIVRRDIEEMLHELKKNNILT